MPPNPGAKPLENDALKQSGTPLGDEKMAAGGAKPLACPVYAPRMESRVHVRDAWYFGTERVSPLTYRTRKHICHLSDRILYDDNRPA